MSHTQRLTFTIGQVDSVDVIAIWNCWRLCSTGRHWFSLVCVRKLNSTTHNVLYVCIAMANYGKFKFFIAIWTAEHSSNLSMDVNVLFSIANGLPAAGFVDRWSVATSQPIAPSTMWNGRCGCFGLRYSKPICMVRAGRLDLALWLHLSTPILAMLLQITPFPTTVTPTWISQSHSSR